MDDNFVVQFNCKFLLLFVFFVGIFFHFTISFVRACALGLNIFIIRISYLFIICMQVNLRCLNTFMAKNLCKMA